MTAAVGWVTASTCDGFKPSNINESSSIADDNEVAVANLVECHDDVGRIQLSAFSRILPGSGTSFLRKEEYLSRGVVTPRRLKLELRDRIVKQLVRLDKYMTRYESNVRLNLEDFMGSRDVSDSRQR